MTIKYHYDLVQGSDEWLRCRCGLLTASEMKHIISYERFIADKEHKENANKKVEKKKKPKTEIEKEMTHLYELLAQRITGYVEPRYISDDMLRGMTDEIEAREIYAKHYGEVKEVGFVTNDRWGFVLGYSPDGLVGEDGAIEGKSRRQKYQVESILDNEMPTEFMMQVQTGLLVTERKWCDFITYSGGLHMFTHRVYANKEIQGSIIEAAALFHEKLDAMLLLYKQRLADKNIRLIPTERKIEQEMIIT